MPIQRYDVQRSESEGGGFTERYWNPVNAPVLDAAGTVIYLIHRVEDVTDRVRLERERDRVIQELQRALSDLKTLTGMIPICAWCKKVRDEQGAWQKLEASFPIARRPRSRTACAPTAPRISAARRDCFT
jgi:hypothetical protein